MTDVAFIHCIEKKESHSFEQDALIMLESMKLTNEKIFNTHDIHIIQPSTYDIDDDTINYFNENNIIFIKKILNNPQKNTHTNYTNIPIIQNYYSNILKNKYMCWMDLDVMYLKDISDKFQETDKCVLSIMDLKRMPEHDAGFQVNDTYQKYFKKYISLKYNVEHLDCFVNTWFIYAKTENNFWKEYSVLTKHLLNIVHEYHMEVPELESMCEEIAASILYQLNKDGFIDISVYFGTNVLAYQEPVAKTLPEYWCTNDSIIYHYNNASEITKSISDINLYTRDKIIFILQQIIGIKKALLYMKTKLSEYSVKRKSWQE